MNRLRIIVTGGAGFIGSHTVDRMLGSGYEVVAVDNLSSGRAENLSRASKRESFRFEYGDVTEPGFLESLGTRYRPDAIVHLAGLVSVIRANQEPDLNFRLNVDATRIVAEAARNAGIGRIVFASSAAVYGDSTPLPCGESQPCRPINLYGAAKSSSEQLLLGYGETFGIDTIPLRFFNVFGPRQDPASPYSGVLSIFARRLAQKRAIEVFGDGRQTRDFISVFDVARAVELAATCHAVPSVPMNVCTGRPSSLLEVLETLRRIDSRMPDPIFSPARSGEILHSRGCPETAAENLRFRSEISLERGLRNLLGVPVQEQTPSSPLLEQVA